jgi:hypothetical protein
MKWWRAVAATGCCALTASGCGGASPLRQNATEGTPLHAALGWFAAINEKNDGKAASYLAPAARGMMDWGPASAWPVFAHVHCTTTSATRADAELNCTFNESSSPSEGNPDTWWSVHLRRDNQAWLIDSYGQP